MSPGDGLPVLAFESAEAWEAWLEENHGSAEGIWLKMAKKASGLPTVAHGDAVESALCFGWIDGQRRGLDETHYLQRYTPRRRGSIWSKINRENATRLIEEGRMRPAGLREVDLAKADGRWDNAYSGQRAATVPADLQRELDANPRAAAFFESLDATNRYAILFRVETSKRPETRAARIQKFVAMLAAGERIHA